MNIPENVSLNHIQTTTLRLLENIRPHLESRKPLGISVFFSLFQIFSRLTYIRCTSGVMNGTREHKFSFAINDERSAIVGNTNGTICSNTKSQNGKNQSNKHLFKNRHGIDLVDFGLGVGIQ